MRQKPLKLFLTALISGALIFSPIDPAHSAEESVTLFMKSLSIDTLTVDFTKPSQNVTLIGILKSPVALKPEDLNCGGVGEMEKSRTITISSLGNDFYRVVCALSYAKATAPIRGMGEFGLEISDDNSNLNWQMVPLNSSLFISQTGKDEFGIQRTKKIRLYGSGTSTGFSVPTAISPPSDYKPLAFTAGPDGFLIFDVADAPAAKPQVIFSKDKKTMSLKFPLPATAVSPKVNKLTQVSFWINNKLVNPIQMLGNWFEPATFNKVAIDKSLKGKSAKVFCATKYALPESNVFLGYVESTEITIQFPK